MPYVNIREEDITPVVTFDTIENAVLIFGFNFSKRNGGVESDSKTEYKIYTSVSDFYKDIKATSGTYYMRDMEYGIRTNAYRPYVTAYDCLAQGLPVIYYSLDNYIPEEAYVETSTDSEGEVFYQFFSEKLPPEPTTYEGSIWQSMGIAEADIKSIIKAYKGYDAVYEYNQQDSEGAPEVWVEVQDNNNISADSEGHLKYTDPNTGKIYDARVKEEARAQTFAQESLLKLFEALASQPGFYFADKINFPFTFVTTCGWENQEAINNTKIVDQFIGLTGDPGDDGLGKARRLDYVYLYDFSNPETTPNDLIKLQSLALPVPREVINIVYPWGHYNSLVNSIHMPGSYGYLMAYANAIKSNKPWLAVAGINRGYIPNIVSIDYNISEPYIHAFQGDEGSLNFRVNPIINFGSNFGTVIFGNRTNFVPNTQSIVFRSFLNVRLLLAYIHKQAFNSSIQHMYEPNDDIVWLSFKQKVNNLLDQMVSGRGIRWYKWYKLQPDTLGQIKAKLVIRPIEAVEAFDITISMTDAEIEVAEEY